MTLAPRILNLRGHFGKNLIWSSGFNLRFRAADGALGEGGSANLEAFSANNEELNHLRKQAVTSKVEILMLNALLEKHSSHLILSLLI